MGRLSHSSLSSPVTSDPVQETGKVFFGTPDLVMTQLPTSVPLAQAWGLWNVSYHMISLKSTLKFSASPVAQPEPGENVLQSSFLYTLFVVGAEL